MYKATVPIFLAPNNAYAPHAGITITSLMENSSRDYFYEIYVLHTDLSLENIHIFESMKYENARVKCLSISRFIEKELKLMYTNFHFSKEMFYRILIPEIFTQFDKAIYLDSDIVVLGDISELYEKELGNCILGGANDIMHQRSKSYVTGELGLDADKYINSGVLLINSKLFREEKIKDKLFDELKVRQNLRYPDQDLINIVCGGRILLLERKWNFIWHYLLKKRDQSLNLLPEEQEKYEKEAKDINILHFTSSVKPWSNRLIPLSQKYWDYVDRCAFKDKIVTAYNKLPRKNYVTLHFADLYDGYLEITASLCTIEGETHENVAILAGGEERELKFITSHNVDIGGKYFFRSVFKFKIPFEEIENDTTLNFYSKDTGLKYLVVSSPAFDVDINAETYRKKGDYIIHARGGAVFFSPYSREKLGECKKQFKKRVRFLCREKKDAYARKANLIRFVHKLVKPFFRKEIWLVSDRCDSAGDNGEVFFKYLKKNKVKGVKPCFVINKDSADCKRLKKIGTVLHPKTVKYKLYYTFATKNISSQLEFDVMNPLFCRPYLKDIIDVKNVFLQHGIIKDDLSMCYNRLADDMHIFVTSAYGEYNSIAYNDEYLCGERITALTGLPRFDNLVNEAQKLIFFLPTWRKSALANMQTGELANGFTDSSYFKFYNALLKNERLISAAKKNGYRLCFYPHHLMKESNKYFGELDEVFVSSEGYTYNDVFKKGALLFTDYSSTQFDFAYLKKPVVYCHFDKDEFFSSHSYKAGYFEYERDGFGEVTYDLDGAVDTLISYMENGCQMKEIYKARHDTFFAYDDRGNCKRVLDKILSLDK